MVVLSRGYLTDLMTTVVESSQHVESGVHSGLSLDEQAFENHAVDLDHLTDIRRDKVQVVSVEPPAVVIQGVQNLGIEASTEVGSIDILDWSSAEIALAQHADRDIGVIHTMMSSNAAKPLWKEIAVYSAACKSLWHQWGRLVLRDGVLYRQFYPCDDGLPSFLQLVVPYKYRNGFIRLAHGGMTVLHLGRRRTEAQVRNRGYWPGWTDDVRCFLRRCGPCSRYHRGPPPKLPEMQPMLVGEPFE